MSNDSHSDKNGAPKRRSKTYDSKCLHLAEAFIADLQITSAEQKETFCDELAKRIQDTVEDYIRDLGRD